MIVYISGPISGIPDGNRPAFYAAQKLLQKNKDVLTVVNPHELDHFRATTWADHMRVDIAALMNCNTVYMLNGWAGSHGAKMELDIARRLNYSVIFEGVN